MEDLVVADRNKEVLARAAVNISNIRTSSHVQIVEKHEQCRIALQKLSDTHVKIKLLTSAKTESLRRRDEYRVRLKTCALNTECLTVTKNELEKLRSDAKAEYIMMSSHAKRAKEHYMKVMSEYTKKWEAQKEEYERFPMVIEINEVKKEVGMLQENKNKVAALLNHAQAAYNNLVENFNKNMKNYIVELALELVEQKKMQVYYKKEVQCRQTELKRLKNELAELQSVKLQAPMSFRRDAANLDLSNLPSLSFMKDIIDIREFDVVSPTRLPESWEAEDILGATAQYKETTYQDVMSEQSNDSICSEATSQVSSLYSTQLTTPQSLSLTQTDIQTQSSQTQSCQTQSQDLATSQQLKRNMVELETTHESDPKTAKITTMTGEDLEDLDTEGSDAEMGSDAFYGDTCDSMYFENTAQSHDAAAENCDKFLTENEADGMAPRAPAEEHSPHFNPQNTSKNEKIEDPSFSFSFANTNKKSSIFNLF